MNIYFDQGLTENYRSKSQIARILTESWALKNIYCPRCGHDKILHFPNNSAVADFYCPSCNSEYELKSKKGSLGKKIPDGAYDTFLQRITSQNNPDFLFLPIMKMPCVWKIYGLFRSISSFLPSSKSESPYLPHRKGPAGQVATFCLMKFLFRAKSA